MCDIIKDTYLMSCRSDYIEPMDAIMNQFDKMAITGERVLNLTGVNVCPKNCKMLAKIFDYFPNYFTQIKLNSCSLSNKGVSIIAEALAASCSLESLELKGNNIQGAAMLSLSALVRRTNSLRRLSLEFNAMGFLPEYFDEFCDALAANTTIVYLDLKKNQLNNINICELAKALRYNYTLKQVDLSHNSLGIPGALVLCQGLKHNQTLCKLDLDGNNIPPDIINAIVTNLQCRHLNLDPLQTLGREVAANSIKLDCAHQAYKDEMNQLLCKLSKKHRYIVGNPCPEYQKNCPRSELSPSDLPPAGKPIDHCNPDWLSHKSYEMIKHPPPKRFDNRKFFPQCPDDGCADLQMKWCDEHQQKGPCQICYPGGRLYALNYKDTTCPKDDGCDDPSKHEKGDHHYKPKDCCKDIPDDVHRECREALIEDYCLSDEEVDVEPKKVNPADLPAAGMKTVYCPVDWFKHQSNDVKVRKYRKARRKGIILPDEHTNKDMCKEMCCEKSAVLSEHPVKACYPKDTSQAEHDQVFIKPGSLHSPEGFIPDVDYRDPKGCEEAKTRTNCKELCLALSEIQRLHGEIQDKEKRFEKFKNQMDDVTVRLLDYKDPDYFPRCCPDVAK